MNKNKKTHFEEFGVFLGLSDSGVLQKKTKKDRNFKQIKTDPEENLKKRNNLRVSGEIKRHRF